MGNSRRHPFRVLILVEDSDDAEWLHQCLAQARNPYTIEQASHLEQALAELDDRQYDALIVAAHSLAPPNQSAANRAGLNLSEVPAVLVVSDDGHEPESSDSHQRISKQNLTSQVLDLALQHVVQRQRNKAQIQRLSDQVAAQRRQMKQQKVLLKQQDRRLRKLHKTADRLLDNVSHEFRTPLTVIQDYISLVREGLAGPVNDEQRRLLDTAAVRANDLDHMVDDVLDISKIESGLLVAWRRNGCVADVIQEERKKWARKAVAMGVRFEVSCADDLPQIYCDAEQVGRVIANLVFNAFKVCGDAGIVRLWAVANLPDNEVVIGVTDNGPGIAPRTRQSIFQRHWQDKQAIQSSSKGFGLGLTIAREIVDLNLGQTNVQSEVGKGSTFSFSVPLAQPYEVMRRYLDRLARNHAGESVMSLLHTSIDPTSETHIADATDCFFNLMLRGDDLLFRPQPHDWLWVVPASQIELHPLLTQLREEHGKVNRNRPYCPLPNYELSVAGTWPAVNCRETILDRFDSFFAQTDAVLA